jgi:gluconokinase
MIVIVMGVSGVGKTTIGQELARELHWRFADADDYHSAANVEKMRSGIALTDADREPWLQALHDSIADWIEHGESVVLACSALKESYRKRLMVGPEVRLVFLNASSTLIAARLATRHSHYMNPELLRSQFDTLEVPSNAISVDASGSVGGIVASIRDELGI